MSFNLSRGVFKFFDLAAGIMLFVILFNGCSDEPGQTEPVPEVGMPLLVSPVNGFPTSAHKIIFKWIGDDNATGYKIEVANNMDFDARITEYIAPGVDTIKTSVTLPDSGIYYWQIGAKNLDNEWVKITETWTFMITDIVFASKEFPLGDTGLNIEMMKIPAGVFLMGSLSSEQGRDSDEGPAHEVHIETPFWISTKEVTKNQWEAVTGYDPCYFSGANYPVESVSFEDVNVFLDTLNAQSGVTWSLPSEAQWEYACRAGTITRYSWGYDAELSTIGSYSWFQENAGSAVYSVGQLLPNPWGLYDMNGNVYEWCQDTYHDSFNGAPAHGGAWTDTLGEYRVIRGGSFASDYSSLRSAFRYFRIPQDRFNQLGFRLVINVLI